MSERFTGTVNRSYALDGKRVVILETGYDGDIEQGDLVEIAGAGQGRVESLAWGSAFDAESPPLTIIVDGLSAAAEPGANVKSVVPAG